MFEIGSTLREARERQGLSLARAEADTRIRARWLKLLEEERFDLLPERVYAIGFLRTYARYLGLEEQRFVDELSSRLEPAKEPEVVLVPQAGASRRRPAGAWVLVLAAVGAVAVVLVGLIGLDGKKHPAASPPPTASSPPPTLPTATTTTRAVAPPARPKPKARVVRLALTASRGRCWLEARAGSPNGRVLDSGMLEAGQSLRLAGRRIWIRLGAPTQLDATVDGRRAELPPTTPVNVVVTASGIRAVP